MNEALSGAIHEYRMNNESCDAPGWCRETASHLVELAQTHDPAAHVQILAYPAATTGEQVHYCVAIDGIVHNLCPTAGFPKYVGPLENAPAFFGFMQPVDEIL